MDQSAIAIRQYSTTHFISKIWRRARWTFRIEGVRFKSIRLVIPIHTLLFIDSDYGKFMSKISCPFSSVDAMQEKLEKWRCMKGKRCRASQDATNVYNRSKSAVAIGLPRNNKFVATRSSSSTSVALFNSNNDKKR